MSPINSITQGPIHSTKQTYLDSTDSVLTQNRRTDFEKIHHNSNPSMLGADDKGRNSYLSQTGDGMKTKDSEMNLHNDMDGNVDNETKSISSNKSSGSNQDTRYLLLIINSTLDTLNSLHIKVVHL